MGVSSIHDKQNEQLKEKTLKERMKAAARLAAAEMRQQKETSEPDQLASGKSGKKREMVWEDDNDHDD